MANVNRPSGLTPLRNIGAPFSGQDNLYFIPSTDLVAYYVGDLVLTGGSADANGVPTCVKALATDTPVRGVITGIQPDPTNLSQVSVPATKTRGYYVYVCDDPNAEFDIQADAGTPSNLVAASVGLNAKIIVTAPSPATGPVSASTLDSGNIAATATFPLKILGLRQLPNNAFGSYCRLRVAINCHELKSVGTLGV